MSLVQIVFLMGGDFLHILERAFESMRVFLYCIQTHVEWK